MSDLKVKISMIGLFDMLKFKKMSEDRDAVIEAAPTTPINAEYAINNMAKDLHPDYMKLKIDKIVDYGDAGAKKFVFKRVDGQLPNFRAGQYLSLKLHIDKSYVTRPYSICSSPKDAYDKGLVAITVKRNPGGYVAEWMLDNLKEGDEVISSDPQGHFFYQELRDEDNVIALAGGSGITPFLSMAKAIVEGDEDFKLRIIFGSRTRDMILFKDELDELADKSNGKVKVVHVLSDEEAQGYETGFITADLIKKSAPKHGVYSVYVCGPEAMYNFTEKEIAKLDLPRRLVRRELLGVAKDVTKVDGYNGDANATYKVTVKQAGFDDRLILAKASEPLLVAFERAGIKAPSRCRSGECGWCRSQLLEGEVFVPEDTDGRRHCDKVFNTIHPCASFPKSDCVVEVPGEYWG